MAKAKIKKILIVDDEKDFTELVKTVLEETGKYIVETVNHGQLALSAAKNFKPHLILLDLMLPDLEGAVVAEQLGDEGSGVQATPVIFLTGMITVDEEKEREGSIGGRKFLAKPVGIRELIECVEQNVL
ncbi:MAG: response regulator [Candidatus Omnitrophota bacterium]